MKPFVPSSDDEYFKRLVEEAPYVEGWHTNTETLDDIEWLDRDLLERGKDFMIKNRMILAASTGVAALYGVAFKNVSLPFIQTGTLSPSPEKTAKRTVKHVTHFVEWFTLGVTDAWVYNDISKIKKMHAYLSKNIKPYEPPSDESVPDRERLEIFREAVLKDLKEMDLQENAFEHLNTYSPQVNLSQFDMVIIQTDLLAAYFRNLSHGIVDEEGLKAFTHHWAVVGRLLGIQDRFNLALHPSRALHWRIARNALQCFFTMDLALFRMFEAHLEAVRLYFSYPVSTVAIMYGLTREGLPGFNGANLRQLMGLKDKVGIDVSLGVWKIIHTGNWMRDLIIYSAVKFYGRISTRYHKLSREDRLKLPIEVFA